MITAQNESGSITRNASFFKQVYPGTAVSNSTESQPQEDAIFDQLGSDTEPKDEVRGASRHETSFSESSTQLCPEAEPPPVRRSERERKAPSRLIEEV